MRKPPAKIKMPRANKINKSLDIWVHGDDHVAVIDAVWTPMLTVAEAKRLSAWLDRYVRWREEISK